jgi:hypothetical protein
MRVYRVHRDHRVYKRANVAHSNQGPSILFKVYIHADPSLRELDMSFMGSGWEYTFLFSHNTADEQIKASQNI